MKLEKGSITFLFNHEGATLEIKDCEANITFVEVKLNAEQVCKMLSRLGCTPCEQIKVHGLDKVGKKHTNKSFVFELPEHDFLDRKRVALEKIKQVCPEGWKSDNYFDSQDSFFTEDGKEFAKVTIRKWE